MVASRLEPLGEGVGFAGQLARIHVEYAGASSAGPASLVAKLPGAIRLNRAAVELSQGYEREVRFYRELAARSRIGTPRVYLAEYDPDPREAERPRDRERLEKLPLCVVRLLLPVSLFFAGRSKRRYVVLMEDLGARPVGDQLAGCGPYEARRVARALAALHAGFWEDPGLIACDWVPRPDWNTKGAHVGYRTGRRPFVREYGAPLPGHFLAATDWVDAHLGAILARLSTPPRTLLHGDYRLDNLLAGEDGIVAVDWQSIAFARGVTDWAYFAMGSLPGSVDALEEQALLRVYHEALLDEGATDYPFAACERDYVLSKLLIAYANVAATRFLRLDGERGDALLATIRERLVARVPPPPWAGLLSSSA